jgi:copper transport protein
MSRATRLAASAALALGLALAAAPAASAHAILLRTEPSPQTTVKQSPTAVKLHFSEAVEAAFGAVRLFDVDGHRVDSGKLSRADGDKEVDLPVPHLKDGSYTLTWRVVSADGHPVHGGFSFYVGAPSTISAVAVAGDASVGRTVSWGFGIDRFSWFAAFFALVGTVVLRRWVWTPAVAAGGLRESAAADTFRRHVSRTLGGAWVALAVAGALSLVFQAATASGLSLAVVFHFDVLNQVLQTNFGRLWLWTIGLTAAAAVPVFALRKGRALFGISPRRWADVLLAAAAGLAVVTAMNGHARTLPHERLGVPSLAVHLMAVAVWVGGLGALVVLGGLAWRSLSPADRPVLVGQLVRRFGRLALVAVAVVVASGTLNAVLDLGSVGDLWRLRYGQIVLAKIALLAIALAFAARHHWAVPRRLAAGKAGAVKGFARSSAVELAVLTGAVALAAGLVALIPGRSVALAAKGPVNQERHAGSYTVQLFIDPTAPGPNEVHVTFVDAQGLGAAEITNAQVSLVPAGGDPQTLAMRLISPGHFVGDTTLAPGPYRIDASTGQGASTSFDFRLRGSTPASTVPTP